MKFLNKNSQMPKNKQKQILQNFFRVVEVEPFVEVEGRSDDALRHCRLELDAEVHQLSLEEHQQKVGVVVREEVDVFRRLLTSDEIVAAFLASPNNL